MDLTPYFTTLDEQLISKSIEMNEDYSAIKCFVFFPDCQNPNSPKILYLTLGENTYNTVISDIHHDDDGVRTACDWNPLYGIDKTNIYNESQGLAMAMDRITTGFSSGTSYFTSYKYPKDMRYDILSTLPEAFNMAIKISMEKNDADNQKEIDVLVGNDALVGKSYAADHGVSSTMVSMAAGKKHCLTVGHFYDVRTKDEFDPDIIYPTTLYEYKTVGFGFILNQFLFYIVGNDDVDPNYITFRVRVLHSSGEHDFIGPSQFNANIGPISRNEYCHINGIIGGINGLTQFQRALFKVAADRVVLAPMIYSIYGKQIPEMIIGATHDKLAFASLAVVNVEEYVRICNVDYNASFALSLGCIYARTVLRELTEKILNSIILNTITGQAVAPIDAATLGNEKEAIVLSIPRTSNPDVIEKQNKTAEIAELQRVLTINAELISTTIQNLRNAIALFTAITNISITRSFNGKIDDIIKLFNVIIKTGLHKDVEDQIFTPTISLLLDVKNNPSYRETHKFKRKFSHLMGLIQHFDLINKLTQEQELIDQEQELIEKSMNVESMKGGVGKYKEKSLKTKSLKTKSRKTKSRKTKSRKTKSRKTKYHKQKLSKCLDKSQIGKKRLNCLRKMYQNNINKF